METCSFSGCERPAIARKLCTKHYQGLKKLGFPLYPRSASPEGCSVAGCHGTHEAKGLCTKHYQRLIKHGDQNRERPKGRGSLRSDGYVDMPIENKKKTKQHIQVAEIILGRPLPSGAVVHHVNEIRSDNSPCNLVICPDRAYHNLIHQRMRALDVCGNADWRKCQFCKRYDAVDRLKFVNNSKSGFYHASCRNADRRAQYANNHRKDQPCQPQP